MDYYESAEGQEITKARAIKELKRHGLEDDQSVTDFLHDLGDRETYDAQEVLDWLGY